MERGYLNLVRLYKILFLGIMVSLVPTIFAFYPMTWKDLMYQMEKKISWNAARMETIVQVFDPFLEISDSKNLNKTTEIKSRSFNQIIHWKDGEIMVVETLDNDEKLLHFYYENNDEVVSISLNDNRSFAKEDILPIQLRFKSRFEEERSNTLEEFGIFSKKISYHIREDNNIFIRIGNLNSGHFALINPKSYDLSSLHSKIWKDNESSIDLKIIFKKYEKYRWQMYPVITEYFLNDRLFKRVKVKKVRTLSSIKIGNFKQRAQKLLTPKNTTLINDYAL